MSKGIKLHVWGDFACFTRPEMKVERVSYDMLTPSAAGGILEAIYWKPQFRWKIDKIHLLAPIRFTSIRRNEVKDKASAQRMIEIEDSRVQRAALLLRDVAYGIEATIEILDRKFERNGAELSEHECVGKHLGQFERHARAGAHFHQPYFGNREFPVNYRWIEQDAPFPAPSPPLSAADTDRELGFILHDFSYDESKEKNGTFIESNRGRRLKATPKFFRARLQGGILDVNKCLSESPLTA